MEKTISDYINPYKYSKLPEFIISILEDKNIVEEDKEFLKNTIFMDWLENNDNTREKMEGLYIIISENRYKGLYEDIDDAVYKTKHVYLIKENNISDAEFIEHHKKLSDDLIIESKCSIEIYKNGVGKKTRNCCFIL